MKPGTCKHKTSTYHDECCAVGVRYDDVCPNPEDRTGKAYRYACTTYEALSDHGKRVVDELGPQGTCEKYEEPTADEIAEHEAEIEKATQRMMRTLPLIARIKLEHKDESWKGTEECPECGGVLHLTHAADNGHVWGQCETEGCLAWME